MQDNYNVDDILNEVRRKKTPREQLPVVQKPAFVLTDTSDDLSSQDSSVTQAVNVRQQEPPKKSSTTSQETVLNVADNAKTARVDLDALRRKRSSEINDERELDVRRKQRVNEFMGDVGRFVVEEESQDAENVDTVDELNPLKRFFEGMSKDVKQAPIKLPDVRIDDYMPFHEEENDQFDEDDEDYEHEEGLFSRIMSTLKRPPDTSQKLDENGKRNYEAYDETEYNSPKDTTRIKEEIWAERNRILIRLVITTTSFVLLFYFAVANFAPLPLPPFMFPEQDMPNFLMANLSVLFISILSSSSVIGNGLISLFTMKSDQDTPTALASVVTFGHGIALAVNAEYILYGQGHFYFVAAGLILMFNSIGSFLMINRIWSNFKIASSGEVKRGFYVTNDPKVAEAVCSGQDLESPILAYTAPVSFPQGFLAISYDNSDGVNRIVCPLFLFFATLIIAVSVLFFNASAMDSLTFFTAMVLISCPLTSTLMVNLPLFRASKKLNPLDSYITGDESIDEIESANSLLVEASDLYPSDKGILYGIKPMDSKFINQCIIDMASVMVYINGSLKKAFMAAISNDQSMLKVVEQVLMVDGKGLIANIESRTILIGNRELLQQHGINAPSRDFEFKLTKGERNILYITSDGVLGAIFVVGYGIDEDTEKTISALSRRGIALCVRSYDPNITVDKIADDYGYKSNYITLITSKTNAILSKIIAKRSKSVAHMMVSWDAEPFFKSFAMTHSLKRAITVSIIIQIVGLVLGYGAVAFLSFTNSVTNMGFIHLVIYQLAWAVVVGLMLIMGV